MPENKTLEQIAEEAKKAHTEESTPAQSEPRKAEGILFDDDNFIMEDAKKVAKDVEKRDSEISTIGAAAITVKPITKEEIMNMMPKMEAGDRNVAADSILSEMQTFRKNLMIKSGFTEAEADEAARNRAKRTTKEYENKWIDEHPHSGVLTIDKANTDKLGLTKEEHQKLVTTKLIRLNLIETEDLKVTHVHKLPSTISKIDFVRNSNAIAYNSTPLPALGDYVSFKGATSAEITNSGIGDDEDESNALNRTMTFIYNHYDNGNLIKKYDSTGKIILQFDKFCEMFPFFDIDMALYSIFVASCSGPFDIDLTCRRCQNNFKWKLDPKNIFNVSEMDDNSQAKIRAIMAHSTDNEWLKTNSENSLKATMFESSETKNRFVIQMPSTARAQRVREAAKRIGMTSGEGLTDVIIADVTMLSAMYIYDANSKEYVEFNEEDIGDMLNAIPLIHEGDFNLITKFARDLYYTPVFNSGDIVCEKCKNVIRYTPDPVELLFLRAQDSFKEIQ